MASSRSSHRAYISKRKVCEIRCSVGSCSESDEPAQTSRGEGGMDGQANNKAGKEIGVDLSAFRPIVVNIYIRPRPPPSTSKMRDGEPNIRNIESIFTIKLSHRQQLPTKLREMRDRKPDIRQRQGVFRLLFCLAVSKLPFHPFFFLPKR